MPEKNVGILLFREKTVKIEKTRIPDGWAVPGRKEESSMMISTELNPLGERFGDEAAIRMVREAGFDAFDMSLFRMNADASYEPNGKEYRKYMEALRRTAEREGIVCNQAHAPFPSSYGEPQRDEAACRMIERAIACAAILGAKTIVVHPVQHLKYAVHAARLREMNLDFYTRLARTGERCGIRIAVENMWQYREEKRPDGRIWICDSTCSSAEEFCDYVDMTGSPWITACLDIGHAPLTGRDAARMIEALGHDRLLAIHVHDNDLIEDAHTLPFLGKIDFEAVCRALAKIRYAGDMTLEADGFLRRIPEALYPRALSYMADTARFLAKRVEDFAADGL